MTKGQLIDDIRALNPTAQSDFLNQFDEIELRAYADRLHGAADRQRRIGGWFRRARKIRAAG